MSDLVGNPEDWFSHNEAHMMLNRLSNEEVPIIFHFMMIMLKSKESTVDSEIW